MRPIDTVIPYAQNPRKNADAIPKVAASIREFGFRQPIVVDTAGVVIAGHTRLEAARSLGLTEVPVHVAQNLTAAQIRAYRIADNRTAEEAEWEKDLLAGELQFLRDDSFDLLLTGFDDKELARLLGEPTDPADTAPTVEGIEYKVVVTCRDEMEQATICEELESRGLKCQLLML